MLNCVRLIFFVCGLILIKSETAEGKLFEKVDASNHKTVQLEEDKIFAFFFQSKNTLKVQLFEIDEPSSQDTLTIFGQTDNSATLKEYDVTKVVSQSNGEKKIFCTMRITKLQGQEVVHELIWKRINVHLNNN